MVYRLQCVVQMQMSQCLKPHTVYHGVSNGIGNSCYGVCYRVCIQYICVVCIKTTIYCIPEDNETKINDATMVTTSTALFKTPPTHSSLASSTPAISSMIAHNHGNRPHPATTADERDGELYQIDNIVTTLTMFTDNQRYTLRWAS